MILIQKRFAHPCFMLLLQSFFYSAMCLVTKETKDKYSDKHLEITEELDEATDKTVDCFGKYAVAYDKYIKEQNDKSFISAKLTPGVNDFTDRQEKFKIEIATQFQCIINAFTQIDKFSNRELDDIVDIGKTSIKNKCRMFNEEYKKYSNGVGAILCENYIEATNLNDEFTACGKQHAEYQKQIEKFEENIMNNVEEAIKTFCEENHLKK